VLPEALRRFALAGEPFGLDPTSLCPAYGLAESALAVTLHPPGEPWRTARLAGPGADDGPELVRCGPAVGDMAVRAAPADAGVGEIEISGSSLFDGYLRADGEIDPPGAWFETRDLGAEVDGELVVTGRVDDLLFVGGAKISAVEVEQAALRAPGVRPDGAAAVQVGTMAFVVVVERRSGGQARTGANDLGHAVRSEVTAALGRGPAEVVVLPPGSLPRTPSGKIQRHRVRALHDGGELEPDARVRFQARREER
jgi:acyl-CoA synthetase (AMP-forming)/AMP-acid ligase II